MDNNLCGINFVFSLCSLFYHVIFGKGGGQITFTPDDIELQDVNYNYEKGGYLDVSAIDKKAVVTPKIQLKKGIYYVEASYAEHGVAKAGLIYDELRNGKDLVNDAEFIVNPEDNRLSFRAKIHNDSAIRFKIRLTGDAQENDYVQLLQVCVVSSKLTYIYPLFCLLFCFLALDLILWGYFKYYRLWNPEEKAVFLFLSFMAFFIGLPLYRNGLSEPANMDLKFHLQRIEGVYKGLLSGQFPVRIQPEWLNGYGYASSVFYGDIFLYFPAVLRIVGFTLQDAYKCYLGMLHIIAVFLSFYSFKKITKNNVAAMTGSVLYVGSTTNLSLLYTTTMVGGYSAMIFFPLIITGFYLVFTQEASSREYKRIWIILTVGFTGLLMTHMISCLIVGVYSVLCCLFMIKKVLRKDTLFVLIKAVCATVFLNLWFLVPFLNYMLSEKLRINSELGRDWGDSDIHALLGSFVGKGDGRSLYNLFLHTDYHVDYAILFILLLICCIFLIAIGIIQGNNNKINFKNINKQTGRLISDFYILFKESTYINMGILGILATCYVILIGGDLNGATICGIFTIIGFGCFGKNIKNTIPIIIGATIAAIFNVNEVTSPSLLLSILFSTTLAPICGKFGWKYGILAGIIHVNIVANIGYLHGGLNLYNNGLAGGFVAMILIPLITTFKKEI